MNAFLNRVCRYKPEVISSFDKFLRTRKTAISRAICFALNFGFWLRQNTRKSTSQSGLGVDVFSINAPKIYLDDLIRYYFPEDKFNIESLSCTIVVPVYNGFVHLERLTRSLFINTDPRCRFIFIDDASTESGIRELLITLSKNPNVKLLTNEKNLGFLGSVNKAMGCVETDYAILLNTDTEVPPMWIPRMIKPFLSQSKLATTTPFTNSGVTFSFPKFGIDNKIDSNLEDIDKAFRNIFCNSAELLQTYSGTGFCMAINMRCWHEIGQLDEKKYGKGYGEENDWCFRATKAGWKHELVCNLFVKHYHGGSFLSDEKKHLMSLHLDILKKEYPNIMLKDVPEFFEKDPWKIFRLLAALLLSKNNATLYIDLGLDKETKSGANSYSQKETKLLLDSGESVLLLNFDLHTNSWQVKTLNFDVGYSICLRALIDVSLLLNVISIKKIVINNLAFYRNIPEIIPLICKIKAISKCRLEYRWHDYFPVCPSFFLIDKDGLPCNVNQRYSCKDCQTENKNFTVQWNKSILEWRNLFNELFHHTDEIRFFSYYSRKIAINFFPIIEKKSVVLEHLPLINENSLTYKRPSLDDIEKVNFCFVGNFTEVKGSKQYIAFAKRWLLKHPNSNFFVLGLLDEKLPPFINYIGIYDREDLGEKLTQHSIHIVMNLSLANETFSYTSQELMLMNVPLVVYSCGAPAERIKRENYFLGEICYQLDIDSLEATVNSLIFKLSR